MNKKIFLLIIAAVLFLVPLAKVSAIQTYVGVKITATTPTNSAGNASDSGKLWCLPVGTYLQVASGSPFGSGLAPIGPSANPVYTTTPTCPGSTIWSGLLNLTNGSLYTIRIDAGEAITTATVPAPIILVMVVWNRGIHLAKIKIVVQSALIMAKQLVVIGMDLQMDIVLMQWR